VIDTALKKAWLKVAKKVANSNPKHYTRSEMESVAIGVNTYDPELAEKIRQMARNR